MGKSRRFMRNVDASRVPPMAAAARHVRMTSVAVTAKE
jgi:hypothetical protein